MDRKEVLGANITPGVRCELVELVKYEDRKEEVLGVELRIQG